jgi:hypothetical protein
MQEVNVQNAGGQEPQFINKDLQVQPQTVNRRSLLFELYPLRNELMGGLVNVEFKHKPLESFRSGRFPEITINKVQRNRPLGIQ